MKCRCYVKYPFRNFRNYEFIFLWSSYFQSLKCKKTYNMFLKISSRHQIENSIIDFHSLIRCFPVSTIGFLNYIPCRYSQYKELTSSSVQKSLNPVFPLQNKKTHTYHCLCSITANISLLISTVLSV